MKKLKLSATITAILGFLSILALIFLYLALADIADSGTTFKFEWYVVGVCLIVLSAFTVSVFITIGFLLRSSKKLINLTTDTSITK